MKIKIFSAPAWCGPCKTYKPTYEKLQEKYPDDIVIYDADDKEAQEEMMHLGIRGIPTTVFGDEKKVGIMSEQELINIIEGNEG